MSANGQTKEDADPHGENVRAYPGTWENVTNCSQRVLSMEQVNPVHGNPMDSCCNGEKK